MRNEEKLIREKSEEELCNDYIHETRYQRRRNHSPKDPFEGQEGWIMVNSQKVIKK